MPFCLYFNWLSSFYYFFLFTFFPKILAVFAILLVKLKDSLYLVTVKRNVSKFGINKCDKRI